MLSQSNTPFRIWGYRYTMQAMVLNDEGLVIRNGDDRVVIPRRDVLRFQRQLNILVREALGEVPGKPHA